MRPVIGITPCSRVDDYVESVRRAGAEPLVLSNVDDPEQVLDRVDGVLLTGGLDVDPALYSETPHEKTEADPERDGFEIPLSQQALARDVPVFAICRGVQVLNVAAGGTLVQDIPSAMASDLDHSIDVPKDAIAHPVHITPGTRLAASLSSGPPLETCAVNSRHHQSVAAVAPSFIVSAVSPDGVIEAIEHPSACFCVGVQWHPENFWRTGEFAGLFQEFVAAAARRLTATHKDHSSTRMTKIQQERGDQESRGRSS
ncbi:MAG TPA: gamma-glutamyl-gamma-aminobutyrate hydrolase family protein [Vicinamibacterales bacterium]|nr:gamma-glutamyl-gamma-aminobutyrate hydrolase family protein [Vicinamibacterales bacterium]